jgi:hypothetical protein
VLEIVERLRADAPDDPFWRGVAEVSAEPGGVEVRFHEGIEPRNLPVGESRVECHLYDAEALARAKELAGR